MVQRIISLLLIPCLLLNQLAALPHCHAHHTDDGHGERAHIHVPWSSSGAKHADQHRHSHDASSKHHHSHKQGHSHTFQHSHADDCSSSCSHKSNNRSENSCSSPFHHDADCIYVADVVAVNLTRLSIEMFSNAHALHNEQWTRAEVQLRPHIKRSDWPPPLLFGHCPLYLRHLSLLI
jgi:hypothetical protein